MEVRRGPGGDLKAATFHPSYNGLCYGKWYSVHCYINASLKQECKHDMYSSTEDSMNDAPTARPSSQHAALHVTCQAEGECTADTKSTTPRAPPPSQSTGHYCSCVTSGSIPCIAHLLPRVYCSSLLQFLGSNDSVVVVDGQLMSLERELDGILGLEDLVEFFELWRETTVRNKARRKHGTRFRKLTVLFRVSGRKKYHTTVWTAHHTMKTM